MIDDFVKGLGELRDRRLKDALNIKEQHENSTKAYKMYSKILDDYLWVVATGRELQEMVAEGINETIYTHEEVSRMIDDGVSKEGLKAIHKVKKAFSGSSIVDISDED